MITPETYSKEWILTKAKENNSADPGILELVVYAFSLLEQLCIHKLNFIFKGGTAMMLLTGKIYRYSTDIDIITLESTQKIESVLDSICRESMFLSWELDTKRSYKGGIPKAHYKLKFQSNLVEIEREVLLDILFEANPYPVLIIKEIAPTILIQEGIIQQTRIPVIDCLLGDKLTAFGPKTIGIPYGKKKGREIVKQIYDIGLLFSMISDIETVINTYRKISQIEAGYRKISTFIQKDIVMDVVKTTIMLGLKFRSKIPIEESYLYEEIHSGMVALDSFLVAKQKYRLDKLIVDASKASYLAAMSLSDKTPIFITYENQDLKEYYFEPKELSPLNGLAKLPGGSLFYLKNAYNSIE